MKTTTVPNATAPLRRDSTFVPIRVPAGWEHPRMQNSDKSYVVLHYAYHERIQEIHLHREQYHKGFIMSDGKIDWILKPDDFDEKYSSVDDYLKFYFGEVEPDIERYIENHMDEKIPRDHFQIYHCHGIPVSPVFATATELITWLAKHEMKNFSKSPGNNPTAKDWTLDQWVAECTTEFNKLYSHILNW